MVTQTTALPTFKNLAPTERIEKSISVGLVGYGRQGELIIDTLPRIPGVHIVAIADIWPWRRELAKNRLRALRLSPNLYETLDEMLYAEGDKIDAVIIATPDWQHANHVSACLKANKHVYCDGEISDSSTKAQELVTLAGDKKLLVQCGHQRRSNPQYIFAFENLLRQYNISTICTHAYMQWHRGIAPLLHVPERLTMSTSDLQRHGYESMDQLLNWEWNTRFGLGDVAYRTGQKLDLLRWFWDAEPVSVTSLGSNDYYNREALDFLMSIFTFKLPTGEIRRGYVQVLSTNASGGDIDKIGVDYLSVSTSEVSTQFQILSIQPTRTDLIRDEEVYNRFTRAIKEGFFACHKVENPAEYKNPPNWRLEEPEFKKLDLPILKENTPIQPHIKNFITAIRDGTKLRDPIEQATKNLIALEAAVQSARERRTIDLV